VPLVSEQEIFHLGRKSGVLLLCICLNSTHKEFGKSGVLLLCICLNSTHKEFGKSGVLLLSKILKNAMHTPKTCLSQFMQN
jgi:hypothetical protein